MKLTCTIPDSKKSCEIEIQSGLLDHQAGYLSSLASRFAIITDENCASLYGEKLLWSLKSSGLEAYLFSFPAGEQYKTRATKELVENQMFEKGLGRDTCVIGLGGGVVTDLAGYIAGTYCRGIPLVMIPTTILGMVDASIGGKSGVNVPYGKNLIGCTHQPKKILIDPLTLKTLPKKELASGIVEMIKHGLIADHGIFEYLEQHADQLLTLDPEVLEKSISESCNVKIEIVQADEKEEGKRHLLNAGHTVAHALETLSHYAIAHGEAVAIGLLVEGYLAVLLGVLSQKDLDRIKSILVKYGLPLSLPGRFSDQAMLDAMALDKKSLKGRPRFVILERIGSPVAYGGSYCTSPNEALIRKALHWMNNDLCSD